MTSKPHKVVDNENKNDIIYLTLNPYHSIGAHDAGSIFCRSQGRSATRTGIAQFPPGRCQGLVVPGKRVFRSAGSRSGQIRDAAPLSIRRSIGCLSISNFRLFTRYLLPDLEAIQGKWNSRPLTKAAWAKRCSQTFAGVGCLYGESPGRRSKSSPSDACRAHQDPLQYLGSSAQYRKGPCTASKKTARIETHYPCKEEVAQRYEHLRGQAIRHLPQRAELGLFVHRGMAAWIKTWCSHATAPIKPIAGNFARDRASFKPDIVMIIAGMVLSCTKGAQNDS